MVKLALGNVRFGSKADIAERETNVRFTPKSGHRLSLSECALCAKSRHYALQRTSLFYHLVGAAQHGLRNSEAERTSHSCVSIYAL